MRAPPRREAIPITDLEVARSRIGRDGVTFVLVRDGVVVAEDRRHGVVPVYERVLLCPADFSGASVADAVLGRAVVVLVRGLALAAAYGKIASRGAATLAAADGLNLTWGSLVDGLRDRTGTGPCPFEAATAFCWTSEQALAAVAAALGRLQAG
jgi:hypothetical protein